MHIDHQGDETICLLGSQSKDQADQLAFQFLEVLLLLVIHRKGPGFWEYTCLALVTSDLSRSFHFEVALHPHSMSQLRLK